MSKNKNIGAPARNKPSAGTLKRLIGMLFKYYKWQMVLVIACIVIFSLVSVAPALYIRTITEWIENAAANLSEGFSAEQCLAVYREYAPTLHKTVLTMVCIYVIGLAVNFTYNRVLAITTQSFLNTLRKKRRIKAGNPCHTRAYNP